MHYEHLKSLLYMGTAILACGLAGCNNSTNDPAFNFSSLLKKTSTTSSGSTSGTATNVFTTPVAVTPGAYGQLYVLLSDSVAAVASEISPNSSAQFVQNSSQGVTTLQNWSLQGNNAQMANIASSATTALGRWITGQVNNNGTPLAATISKNDGFPYSYSAWHYVAGNVLSHLPTTGIYHCDGGTFTLPTYINAGTTSTTTPAYAVANTPKGNATLQVSNSGVKISTTINIATAVATGQTTIAGTAITPTTQLGGSTNTLAYVTDGGSNRLMVIGSYQTTLSDATNYIGTFAFTCYP